MKEPNLYHFELFRQMCDSKDLYAAQSDPTEHGSGLTLFSYEPFAKQKDALRRIIAWCNSELQGTSVFRVRVFCCDGYLECSSRGEQLDEEGEPIPETSVFV